MSKVAIKKHLKELQWRLTVVALFFIIGATLAYTYQAQLVPALMAPLHGERLVYLNPAGGFSFIFLISIYAGLALAIPVLVQQLYAFLRPALPKKAQKKSSVIIVSSFLLLGAGVAFGYFVAVPNALAFLTSFADQYVTSSLTADSYLNFIIAYTIGIGLVFQIPLLLLLIDTIKPLTPKGLFKSERWVILGAFIVAAIITPTPDPINQAIIAGPVIIVYQLGVFAILFKITRTRHAQRKLAKKERKLPVAQQTKATEQAPQLPAAVVAARQPTPTPAVRPVAQPQHPTQRRQRDISMPHTAPVGGLLASMMPNGPSSVQQPTRVRTGAIPVYPRAAQPGAVIPKRPAQVRSLDGTLRSTAHRQEIGALAALTQPSLTQ
jgi:sec-independent protein translocase protein TatC